MMLRYAADYRTLLWMLGFAPGLVALGYTHPDLIKYLGPFIFYFAISAGVIAHNHLHSPTFKSKRLNELFSAWISIFYGYPTFGWIPTHNLNHHKLVNRAGDATITWRLTNRHNLLVAATYFFVSAYYQSDPIRSFIKKARAENPKMYRRIVTQYVVVFGGHLGMLSLGVALYGPWSGLFVWGFTLGLPAFVSLWTIMLFNYEQHVHTDPWSRYNHSRNFVSPTLNFLLFNNGYHAAHHEQPGLHWSKLPELHATFAREVDPALLQSSVWWYWFKQYVLAVFVPSLGGKQIGRAPFDPPDSGPVVLETAEVGVADAGVNESRA